MCVDEQLLELKQFIEDNYQELKTNYKTIDIYYEAINDLLSFIYLDSVKNAWLESNKEFINEIKNTFYSKALFDKINQDND